MLINDTSNLTPETMDKLNELGFKHINTGRQPLTKEMALGLIESFSHGKMESYLKQKGL